MEIEKAKMTSYNVIEENVRKIKNIFPSAVKEVLNQDGTIKLAIDFEMLKLELADALIDEKQERYQMTWPDKKKSLISVNERVTYCLRPLFEKSMNFYNTRNIYIEGDNLDALKILRETYLGKVKMIYIDPPYNTGNDFIYDDDFSKSKEDYKNSNGEFDEYNNRLVQNTESNGRYHTDWLNLIYPRLKVARDFLSDDGVIFISIDENELHNLIKICDEIYGENNFIGIFTVENNPKGRKNSRFISVSCEYCVVYGKFAAYSSFVESVPKNASDLTEDEDGNFVHNSGKRVVVGENNFNNLVTNFSSEKHYSLYYRKSDNQMRIVVENSINDYDEDLVNDGYSRYYSHRDGKFVENTYTREKINQLFQQNLLDFKEDKIYEKNISTAIRIKSLLENREYDGIFNGEKIHKIYDFKTTSAGTAFKELFNTDKTLFSAPKNVCLIKTLIELLKPENEIIMDFFSGSATTAESVIEYNEIYNSNNTFLLIQLPENLDDNLAKATTAAAKEVITNAIELCDSLGYSHHLTNIGEERIRRVIKKKTDIQNLFSNNTDLGFRVFKVDSSNMNDIYYNPNALQQNLLESTVDNVKPDRNGLDLLFQVMLECGALLSSKIEEKQINGKTVYCVSDNYIIACYDNDLDEDTIKEIAKMQPIYASFKDSSFHNDAANINAEQIFKTYSPNTEKIKVI